MVVTREQVPAATDAVFVPGAPLWELVGRAVADRGLPALTDAERRARGDGAVVYKPSSHMFSTPSLAYASYYSGEEVFNGQRFKVGPTPLCRSLSRSDSDPVPVLAIVWLHVVSLRLCPNASLCTHVWLACRWC
jgi:hypothetical protein